MLITPMMARVAAAFLAWGRRNACTPSAIASTPVSAVAPEAKARKIRNKGQGKLGLEWEPRRDCLRAMGQASGEPHSEGQVHHGHEPVGREGENRSCLLHPPQIGQGEQANQRQGDGDLVLGGSRHGRGDGNGAGRHTHGDSEHVVGEDGSRSDQAGDRSQVLPGHDVGAASPRVGPDGLSVGRHHDRQQRGDADSQRHRERQCRRPGGRKYQHHLLGRVGHRREGVGGKDGEGEDLREELMLQPVAGQRSPDQHALESGGHSSGFYRQEVAPLSPGVRAVRVRPPEQGSEDGATPTCTARVRQLTLDPSLLGNRSALRSMRTAARSDDVPRGRWRLPRTCTGFSSGGRGRFASGSRPGRSRQPLVAEVDWIEPAIAFARDP
jgi:hypothetical protein